VTNAAVGRREPARATMSIGAVLALLRPEFPDVTISKIRFLEDQGLVEPDRTPAGYRKFTHDDVERLRYVLSVQRDHYLPLRVIRDHLEALDRGVEAPVVGAGPWAPRLVADLDGAGTPTREGLRDHEGDGGREHGVAVGHQPGAGARLSRAQLMDAAGVGEELVRDLESHGLLAPRPGTGDYHADAVVVARTAAGLAAFGIGPRHLRAFRAAADREAGLVEQVVAPLRRQRGPEAGGRAEEVSREVASLCVRLHAALVKAALGQP